MPEIISETAPLLLLDMEVPADWLDYNGHMNIAHYTSAVDSAMDAFLDMIEMGEDYVRGRKSSMFMIQQHMSYIREMHKGERFVVCARLLDLDEKRYHQFMEFRSPDGAKLMATSENLLMHVDMEARKATPMPADRHAALKELLDAHAGLPLPHNAGRAITIPRKS